MSLARLIKRKSSTDEDLKGIIDKACLTRSKFDIETVKMKVEKLNDYIKGTTEINPDDMMKLFFDVSHAMYAEPPRSSTSFHPSSIASDCERQLFYDFLEYKRTNVVTRKINGQLQRIFDVGTWWHTYIQTALWRAGILEKSEVPVVSKRRRINGRCDGILKLSVPTLLEIKTMNNFSYARGKIAPLEYHETQAGIYASELGITRICYLYINKDTADITVHFRSINEPLVKRAQEKMSDVLSAVREKELPLRVWCTDINSEKAKVCPYATQCFNDGAKRKIVTPTK